MKFNIGDRVQTVRRMTLTLPSGAAGTIIHCDHASELYLIEFDQNHSLHDGGQRGKMGHCWWIEEKLIESCNIDKPVDWSISDQDIEEANKG